MSVRTFLTRLAALVPRPRADTTLYFGVLASHAKQRARVLPTSPPRARAHDASWAALMHRAFGTDRLSCRRCRGNRPASERDVVPRRAEPFRRIGDASSPSREALDRL